MIVTLDAKHISSYKGGGRILTALQPKSPAELKDYSGFIKNNAGIIKVLGACSNTLIQDGSVNLPVIHTAKLKGIDYEHGCVINVSAGERLAKVHNFAEKMGLAGLERLSGIPGSIGGAIKMNAGAFGINMSDIVAEATVFDILTAKTYTLSNGEIAWNYRSTGNSFVGKLILSAKLQSVISTPSAIISERIKYATIRKASQPFQPSLGSVFKQVSGVSAAKYIEQVGLKGTRCGGAEISHKHAGFIVNTGGGTAEDFLTLMHTARNAIKAQLGITLEPEIEILENNSDYESLQ